MITKIIILFIVLLAVCASIIYVYTTTNNLYARIGTFVLGIALLYLTYTHTSEQFKFKSDIKMIKSESESKTDCVCGLDGNCTCKNIECTCDNDNVCSCKHSRFTQ